MQNIKNELSLNKKLYTLRTLYNISHDITMDYLAKELGLSSAQAYYHLEVGRKKTITMAQLKKLAEIYNVTLAFLLDDTQEIKIEDVYGKNKIIKIKDTSKSEKMLELLEKFDLLSPENQDMLKQLATIMLNSIKNKNTKEDNNSSEKKIAAK